MNLVIQMLLSLFILLIYIHPPFKINCQTIDCMIFQKIMSVVQVRTWGVKCYLCVENTVLLIQFLSCFVGNEEVFNWSNTLGGNSLDLFHIYMCSSSFQHICVRCSCLDDPTICSCVYRSSPCSPYVVIQPVNGVLIPFSLGF
jgi:hypothetical protein